MSDLSQIGRLRAILLKGQWVVIQLKAKAVAASRVNASFSAALCLLANLTRVGLPV
jgi:hypothetical protein